MRIHIVSITCRGLLPLPDLVDLNAIFPGLHRLTRCANLQSVVAAGFSEGPNRLGSLSPPPVQICDLLSLGVRQSDLDINTKLFHLYMHVLKGGTDRMRNSLDVAPEFPEEAKLHRVATIIIGL